jgi:trehalose/maltose hydrolase-like predicted phosphorylase
MSGRPPASQTRGGASRLTPWSLVYDHWEPPAEGKREALCALGNGYFVTRGAACEADLDAPHYPGTYRAGLYDRRTSVVDGAPLVHEDLVNLPNWLRLSFWTGDGWWGRDPAELLDFRQELDFARGVLTRTLRLRDRAGRVTWVRERRLVHLLEPHLAAQSLELRAENWSGPLRLRSFIDGHIANRGVPEYAGAGGPHLEGFAAEHPWGGVVTLRARTVGTRVEVATATRTRAWVGGRPLTLRRFADADPRVVGLEGACELAPGAHVLVEKVVALYTGRDGVQVEPRAAAARHVEQAPPFPALLTSHAGGWDALWWRFAIDVAGHPDTAAALHLHLFHILQTVSPNTVAIDAGVPARGWHGEGYRGHVFWDELFVFPVLLYRVPDLVRALLLYRHRRLPEARRAAREAGLRGAMFPWRSASDGRDVTERRRKNPRSGRWIPDNSWLQRHIGAAVAYNVWQYHEVTGDREFLASHGAELLVEVARFWASLAELDPREGRYHIRGVIGPDEFHEGYPGAAAPGLDDNAYTNVMAVWTLLRACEAIDRLSTVCRRELVRRVALGGDELARWRDITRRMFVPFHGDGLVSQFAGYERLAEFDWRGYAARYGDIRRLDDILEAEGDTPNRFKLSKQADVLMLFYLLSEGELREIFTGLGYPWDDALIARNTDYYLRRTSHGSTLSRVVHAWVLARCDRSHSWEILREALGSDLADLPGGTTSKGVHLGAMAGTVDVFQRCYTGLEAREDALWLAPRLPDAVGRLTLRIRYRGAWLDLDIDRDRLRIAAADDARAPVALRVYGRAAALEPGATREFPIAPGPAAPRP